MEAKWYFAESGKSVGPVTAAQIREQIQADLNLSLFVWTAGMAEWTEARTIAEFTAVREAGAQLVRGDASGKGTWFSSDKRAELARRGRHELYEYLGISAYIFVSFGALMFYKSAVLRSVGVEFAPLGFAAVKALISAKFIMLLQALKLDERVKRVEIPFVVILQKAAIFTLFLIVLTVIEELVVGHLHGKESRKILSEMAGGTIPQALSMGLLMFLMMIPILAVRHTGVDLWKSKED